MKLLRRNSSGQSMIEFALILPLMVLIVLGIFELGRAFFAYIAITNAAREGVRVYTFTPDDTNIAEIVSTVRTEIGGSTLVDPTKIADIVVACPGHDPELGQTSVNDTTLPGCPHGDWIRVTVTYNFDFLLDFFHTPSLTMKRSAEMIKP